MKVLLVGGGGREHALAWKLRQDAPALDLLAAPGNPGIAELARCVPIAPTEVDALRELARREHVGLTVVGPEAPLAAGIVDHFRAERLAIFGPTRAAAQIETSKAFAKQLMLDAGVPTARAITCTEPQHARGAARELARDGRVVVKASGLAAGKGVVVSRSLDEADRAIEDMLVGHVFGTAGTEVLIEELMEGEELSVFAITDGERLIPLVSAQDHKRLLNGDRGPNTGGMGAYAPVSGFDLGSTLSRIFHPTLAALRARGTPFTGLLYAGLMLTADGPRVVEFNCRFGDPETEAILPIMRASPSLFDLMLAVGRGEPLPEHAAVEHSGCAATIVLASAGYPERPRTGDRITLPTPDENVLVFHAGTGRAADGALVTSGGRVLAITGTAPDLAGARQRAVQYASGVSFDGKQFRSDIGWRELARSHAGAA